MMKKIRIMLVVILLLAMFSALITFVKSLFYNFHNDTVPFFSIMISSIIALISIGLVIGASICVINYKNSSHSFLFFWLSLLFNVLFSCVCYLIHHGQFRVILAYLLITTLFFIAYFLSIRNSN